MFKNIRDTLLVLITVVAVFLSIGFFSAKQKEKTKKDEAAINLDAFRITLTKLEDDVKDKEKLKSQLDKKLEELIRESQTLEVQISQIQKICDESEAQLATVENDIAMSRGKIKELLGEKEELAERVSKTQKELADLENRLAALTQATNALQRHRDNMKRVSGIKTAPPHQQRPAQPQEAVVPPEPPWVVEAPILEKDSLEGEVLVVNREFNFIVISLGKQSGLKEGDRLYVYDGEKSLGEVYVETVRENISAASGGKNLDAYRIKAGNKVYSAKL